MDAENRQLYDKLTDAGNTLEYVTFKTTSNYEVQYTRCEVINGYMVYKLRIQYVPIHLPSHERNFIDIHFKVTGQKDALELIIDPPLNFDIDASEKTHFVTKSLELACLFVQSKGFRNVNTVSIEYPFDYLSQQPEWHKWPLKSKQVDTYSYKYVWEIKAPESSTAREAVDTQVEPWLRVKLR